MSTIKNILTSNKEEILQALAPLNQHVLENKERFLKALAERDYVLEEDGRIRWSPILLSGKVKKLDKLIEEKVKEINLIYKSKKFMDKIEYFPVQFHLEIIEFCDGFQVNLTVRKDSTEKGKNKDLLDSISYFVWKS